MLFETKGDSKIDVYETGMNRGSNAGKPRFDLIPLWLLNLLQFPFSRVWYRPTKDVGYFPQEFPKDADHTLIDPLATARLAGLLERGAVKYGRDNWQKGAPLKRQFASTLRHLLMWAFGDRSEDHLAAVLFGVMTMMRFEYMIHFGQLPQSFADKGPMKPMNKRSSRGWIVAVIAAGIIYASFTTPASTPLINAAGVLFGCLIAGFAVGMLIDANAV